MIEDKELCKLMQHAYSDSLMWGGGTICIDGNHIVRYDRARRMVIGEIDAVLFSVDNFEVLCFRGTETSLTANPSSWTNFIDVIRNLLFIPWKAPYGWTHFGYYVAAKLWVSKFDRYLPKSKRLILCGHSMGAGVAVNFALLTKSRLRKVVLFAEPKSVMSSTVRTYKEEELASITKSYLTSSDVIRHIFPWANRCVNVTFIGKGEHGIKSYSDAMRG